MTRYVCPTCRTSITYHPGKLQHPPTCTHGGRTSTARPAATMVEADETEGAA